MSAGSLFGWARIRRPGRLLFPLLAVPLTVGTGCVDHSLSPEELRTAQLSMAASFPSSAAQQARAVDGWRVVVSRTGGGLVAEEAGAVSPDQTSVTVALTLTLEAPCEALLVRIELFASGEVWFRAEREHQVCAGRANQVPTMQLEWVGPFIGLAPAQLSFSADQATNPSPQAFTVTNEGGGTLNWTASEGPAWLNVSPASGSLGPGASQSLTATVTSEKLDPGRYQTFVVVSDPKAPNSPRTLPVSLTVIEVANSVLQGTVSVEGTPLGGITVTLSGKETHSTTTNRSGGFEFAGLTSGNYTVTISDFPPDVSFTSTSQSLFLGVNQTRTVDFQGTYVRTSSVRGVITVDGDELPKVTVTLSGTESRSATTDGFGAYAFAELRAGSYTVVISGFPENVSFPASSRDFTLGVGQAATLDFDGSIIRNSSISGTVEVDDSPLADVNVTLSGPQAGSGTTSATGEYSFSGLRDGEYTVEIRGFPAQVSFTATSMKVNLGVHDKAVVDFSGSTSRNSSISGMVTLEGAPLDHVTVTLSGPQSGTMTTDASGRYSFTGLRDGMYTVSVSDYRSDITFPSPTQDVSLGVNDAQTLNFQGSYIRTSSIVGRVTAGETGLGGVTVSLRGTESRNTSTDSSGNYRFTETRSGNYTVSISNLPPGAVFETTSKSVSVGMEQTVQVDFLGSIVLVPSAEHSFIEACPAVIPRPEEVEVTTTLTVGVRDQFGDPMQGAAVSLSLVPPEPGMSFFGSTSLTTGADGLASTSFYSETIGGKTFSAQITASGSTITVQESDDLYVDVMRWDYGLSRYSGNGQTIVAGGSGSFSVAVTDWYGYPAGKVPVGWAVEGGNCLYSFSDGSGIAGMSLYVPASTPPGTYQVTANIADVDWDAGTPWQLVKVVFTYNVVASSSTLPAAPSREESRLRGTPLPPGAN